MSKFASFVLTLGCLLMLPGAAQAHIGQLEPTSASCAPGSSASSMFVSLGPGHFGLQLQATGVESSAQGEVFFGNGHDIPRFGTGISAVVDGCCDGLFITVLTSDGQSFTFACNDISTRDHGDGKRRIVISPHSEDIFGRSIFASSGIRNILFSVAGSASTSCKTDVLTLGMNGQNIPFDVEAPSHSCAD